MGSRGYCFPLEFFETGELSGATPCSHLYLLCRVGLQFFARIARPERCFGRLHSSGASPQHRAGGSRRRPQWEPGTPTVPAPFRRPRQLRQSGCVRARDYRCAVRARDDVELRWSAFGVFQLTVYSVLCVSRQSAWELSIFAGSFLGP
ncbi:hypothetical protein NDU88_000518 [Pleurodeles waltl]|uniref:Uncharacterized protein n=1 Tax=Pleurodeles waltl TaxID=8319 RepID=A0AAV7P467_PLEWA|nr:hypothetical protein NDU88_000518 [Pleurodeles waltl]